ncbi:conserved exported hypothetical protein [Crenothrix polyspora]|uniref:CopG protein n=1 Tax=Crenothrix polyspora TaxID=360316 RepID=A0A1R4HCI7_9GAMM|nr:DUF411 domain-containing protein [Crenothrix polyspora]SJM93945.1 conserved exported hypothetical protein [Crenothrix polyspora]
MKKLPFLILASLSLVNTGVWAANAAKATDIVVYRSPSCSCCGKWLEHLKQNNFNVQDIVTEDVQAMKNKHGVTPELASCHTAIVDGHVIEGHVPAEDIVALLKTKPKDVGLAVPGMPSGTPGMEMGGKKDAYDVISFDSKAHTEVFKHYTSNQ